MSNRNVSILVFLLLVVFTVFFIVLLNYNNSNNYKNIGLQTENEEKSTNFVEEDALVEIISDREVVSNRAVVNDKYVNDFDSSNAVFISEDGEIYDVKAGTVLVSGMLISSNDEGKTILRVD